MIYCSNRKRKNNEEKVKGDNYLIFCILYIVKFNLNSFTTFYEFFNFKNFYKFS